MVSGTSPFRNGGLIVQGLSTQIGKAVLTQAILFYFKEVFTQYTILFRSKPRLKEYSTRQVTLKLREFEGV